MYAFYESIRHWGDHGYWDVNYSGVIKSGDGGNFEPFSDVYFTCSNEKVTCELLGLTEAEYKQHLNANFAQVSPIEAGEYIYFYALEGGRNGSLKLARVLKETFENQSEYEYLCDGERFVKGFEGLKLSAERP